jgi:hypothetical protein
MSYSPSMRRMNLIRQMCTQFLRDNCPEDYAVIVGEAERRVPKGIGRNGGHTGKWNIGESRRKRLVLQKG